MRFSWPPSKTKESRHGDWGQSYGDETHSQVIVGNVEVPKLAFYSFSLQADLNRPEICDIRPDALPFRRVGWPGHVLGILSETRNAMQIH